MLGTSLDMFIAFIMFMASPIGLGLVIVLCVLGGIGKAFDKKGNRP